MEAPCAAELASCWPARDMAVHNKNPAPQPRIASARFVFTAYLSSLVPDPGIPSKIYVGAAADIFALQEPTFQLFRHLIISCVEPSPCRRSTELTLNSGRTILISQTACAKDEVEKEYSVFSRFLGPNNQATESQMNAGLTRIAPLEGLKQSGRFRQE